jgi:cytochrome b subunit of formate dehydrogenase
MEGVRMARTRTIIQGEKIDSIVRFDKHQIAQHWMLIVSEFLAIFTGLPQKFSTWAVSKWWISVWGGMDNVRTVHHFAAYLMIALCIYHFAYIAYSTFVLKRPFPREIIPTRRDIACFFQEIRYYMGWTKEEPKWDRFNWKEKFEYWSIAWGAPVMGITGFILMWPVFFTRFLPGWVVPTALVAHSWEAVIAVVWIFVVHFFFSHFGPGVFPLNKSIFTGKVPVKLYEKEHPLEYERLFGTEEEEEKDSGQKWDSLYPKE